MLSEVQLSVPSSNQPNQSRNMELEGFSAHGGFKHLLEENIIKKIQRKYSMEKKPLADEFQATKKKKKKKERQ